MPLRARLVLALMFPVVAQAQSLDLMIHNTGISIGDSRLVHGLRLNFRDDRMREVIGINITMWTPYQDAYGGDVKGFAIGAPLTGARRISGFGIGILAVGAMEN